MVDFKRHPHKDYPFFLYDEEAGMMFFKTEDSRKEEMKRILEWWLDGDDSVYDAVERMCMGVVTHFAQQTGRVERPEYLDEEGGDGEGTYWPDNVGYMCEYEMLPLEGDEK